MRNLLLIPILALALTLAACGKKKNDDQGAIGGPVVVNPVPQPIPNQNGITFDQACLNYAGTIFNSSPRECQYVESYTFQVSAFGTFNTAAIDAYSGRQAVANPYSHIYIGASENMNVYVGNNYLGHAQTFVTNGVTGPISFNGNYLTDHYSVYGVQVTSRFNELGQYVAF